MTAMEQLAKLEKQFSPEQARAIMDVIETQAITRDYLDARLEAMEKRLLIWGVSIAGTIVVLTTLLTTAVERLIR